MMTRQKFPFLRFIILHSLLLAAGFPSFCAAQSSHLDSTLAVQIAAELSRQAAGKPFAVAADSGLHGLIAAMPSAAADNVALLRTFSASIARHDFQDWSSGMGTPILVNAAGQWIDRGNSVTRPWSVAHSFVVRLSPADRLLLETNRDPYVILEQEPASSFWSNIAEPALVVLGAIAIVALFFLIRS